MHSGGRRQELRDPHGCGTRMASPRHGQARLAIIALSAAASIPRVSSWVHFFFSVPRSFPLRVHLSYLMKPSRVPNLLNFFLSPTRFIRRLHSQSALVHRFVCTHAAETVGVSPNIAGCFSFVRRLNRNAALFPRATTEGVFHLRRCRCVSFNDEATDTSPPSQSLHLI